MSISRLAYGVLHFVRIDFKLAQIAVFDTLSMFLRPRVSCSISLDFIHLAPWTPFPLFTKIWACR